MRTIVNYAHRGASAYAPENTMGAFRKGVELGATGIETDVQLTKDGEVIIIHDEKVNRTTNGKGFVADYTLEELLRLDAGRWFGPLYAGERLPALAELLDLVAATPGFIVNIELKNSNVAYPGLEQKVIDSVRAFGLADRTIISSFNHQSLVLCKKLDPEIRTGILYDHSIPDLIGYAAKQIHADALHCGHKAVDTAYAADAHRGGLLVNPWTVNDPIRMKQLIDAGVDGIITDTPDLLRALL